MKMLSCGFRRMKNGEESTYVQFDECGKLFYTLKCPAAEQTAVPLKAVLPCCADAEAMHKICMIFTIYRNKCINSRLYEKYPVYLCKSS